MLTETQIKQLIEQAQAVRDLAYCPYSQYPVGAALLAGSGKTYHGCNIENAAFTAGICAERVALVKALSEGEREFTAIAVVTENMGTCCGVCRQSLHEHAPTMPIIIANVTGQYRLTSIDQLLPDSFAL